MKISITRVMIPQTPTTSAPRWFVEIRGCDSVGANVIVDDSNHATEEEAIQRVNEIRIACSQIHALYNNPEALR